ncbi:rhomboid-related protein 2 isoform X1 [Toxorhynchites rutilus septentrionalis]|uniref:rhomboid-related protein 2 isoform X1 n=2 Tax=Toxorhynchites rutilus septentrionalis TaxID=329112 RepID=UPI002479EFA3|nr:rhomboid-related protein 2 isoform X1 [Toxorhynchites rutilus septentrionalis]XP_055628144.1 rhomboid-related protein 2 isoform X1 [Toxorhynchites rutilus septentrionalis]XP_055628145.1 rhomboid-related protein 2 isoform X1 [Toxorhynchites rutilus septentrionalis]
MAAYLNNQQRMQRPMDPAHEIIPLQRLTTREEATERQKIRDIFDKYDRDRTGLLSIQELKRMINARRCPDLPKGFVRQMLKAADHNNDGHLDFEEFYQMSREHNYLFRDMCVRYCKLVVPNRNPAVADEPGSAFQRQISVGTVISERDGEYERSMSFWPPPLTMIVFSIVEIIFFVVDIVETNNQMGTSTNGPMATLFIYNPQLREQAWRFVTYMFVHIGFMHIVMNLLVQIFLGVALELVHCWWRVALVYLAGVAAGSMGTSIFSPRVFLAGASGGVYALITAHIATIIMNWSQMEYAIVQLFVFLVFCVTDLSVSIYNSIYDPFDKVGYIAHASGAVAGFLVGIGVLRNLKVNPWERKLWWLAVTVYFSLMGAGVLFHILHPNHFYPLFA